MAKITMEDLVQDHEIRTYILRADEYMQQIGYTEHSLPHVTKVAQESARLLKALGYEERTCELAEIAGYLHDIGNTVNRTAHAQSGAIMAFTILSRLKMDPEEIATVITAIGNHDESTAIPVSPVSAALILSDKSDVRRSRVRSAPNSPEFDIHDRVNYSVKQTHLELDAAAKVIKLHLVIDTNLCAVMEYFEIFITRMLLCRKAAQYLGLDFKLEINGSELL